MREEAEGVEYPGSRTRDKRQSDSSNVYRLKWDDYYKELISVLFWEGDRRRGLDKRARRRTRRARRRRRLVCWQSEASRVQAGLMLREDGVVKLTAGT